MSLYTSLSEEVTLNSPVTDIISVSLSPLTSISWISVLSHVQL